MDPAKTFCPNLDCHARGQIGKGNIKIHSQKEKRYKCKECEKTFAETKGTPFYRLHKIEQVIDLVKVVVTLLGYGCPLQAIVMAFGLDERTVSEWRERAGIHCEAVHKHLVERPRDLGQVQADEIRVKEQGQIVWMAMAIMVSTRLWLGGVISPHRDMTLISQLMRKVRACAVFSKILVCTDGLVSYKGRALVRQTQTLQRGMYLVGTIYNFCTYHKSLRLRINGEYYQRTPAMAAGITDQCWTVRSLLEFRVPPPSWSPPKRRGRISKVTKQLGVTLKLSEKSVR